MNISSLQEREALRQRRSTDVVGLLERLRTQWLLFLFEDLPPSAHLQKVKDAAANHDNASIRKIMRMLLLRLELEGELCMLMPNSEESRKAVKEFHVKWLAMFKDDSDQNDLECVFTGMK